MRLPLLLLLWLPAAFSLRILFHLTLVGKSHLDYANNLIDILVERGHSVDVIMGGLNSRVDPTTVTGNSSRYTSYTFNGENLWLKAQHLNAPFEPAPRSTRFEYFYECENEICRVALNSSFVSAWIGERHYDFGISSAYGLCGPALFYKHSLHAYALYLPTPITMPNEVAMGLPGPPGYVIDWMFGQSKIPSTFIERFDNLLNSLAFHFISVPKYERQTEDIFASTVGVDFPSHKELIARAAVMFVNSNEIMALAHPMTHKIKCVGGIGYRAPRPLSHEMRAILNKSHKGVVIFSFGTQVPTALIPSATRATFARAFEKFPDYTFLWRYDSIENDSVSFPANVRPVKWLPQNDLLNDNRVKLFISHMGLNSLNEATHAGVPFLALPIFLDQPHNTIIAQKMGVAVALDKLALTEERLVEALRELLDNERYRTNAQNLARMLADKPNQPRETFVQWVEFAAKYPGLGEHYNLPSVHMCIVEEYCLDCFAVIVLLLLACLWLAVNGTFRLIQVILRSRKNKTE